MIIKLEPVFIEKIWGGNFFKKNFKKSLPSNIGEAWIASGYDGNETKIFNKDIKLNSFYKNNKELFNNYKSIDFPLLVKILDAKENLSIQVHPDDNYAKKINEKFSGKSECWHILDCEKNGEIIIGNNAKNKSELKKFIDERDFSSLIKKRKIKVGDSFNIVPGTVHAICKNTLLYELQQSSDLTFRIYDYDRLENGKLRELHLKESLETIKFDEESVVQEPKILFEDEKFKRSLLVENSYFNLEKWENLKSSNFSLSKKYNFLIVTNISKKKISINNFEMKFLDTVILTTDELKEINLSSSKKSTLLCGYPK